MPPPTESQYKDLLNPIKDLAKSFNVDISSLLLNFVQELIEGKASANFNSAALILQGSASVYGKKVEYLHNLATQLHNSLLKQKKNDQQDQQQSKKDNEKEKKEKKEDKLSDPFLSVDFKMGKNLSCLRKKNVSKAAAKKSAAKKSKSASIPVAVLFSDNDDKGEVFYDTRGDVIGNKGDFAMNKCCLISSGWLLLPTVNPNLVPSLAAVPDDYDDSDNNDPCEVDFDDPVENNDIPSTDDGIDMHPPSSDVPGSIQSTPGDNTKDNPTDTPVQSTNSTVPSTDEGVFFTPSDENITDTPNTEGVSNIPNDVETNSPEGNENIPAEGSEVRDNSNQAPQPVRQSVRVALQTCQLAVEDDPLAGIVVDSELLVRKKIQKKNCRVLPARLRLAPGEEEIVPPISDFCARTFFLLDDKGLKRSLLNFDAVGFDQNSKFVARILDRLAVLKTACKNKLIDPIEDEQEINVEEIECLQECNEDDDMFCAPFDDNDIQIDHDIILPPSELPARPPSQPLLPDNDVPAAGLESPDITHSQIAVEEYDKHIKDLNDFVQNSDITKRVHEWEEKVKPFLDELEQRESFDINLYGSRILNSFEDNNRKQTKTFRQLCRDKEKWEIHRYFMALLPLANIGNVAIESEPKEDETEEIFVTLLSRKMHHKELEEFGHNDGSHS